MYVCMVPCLVFTPPHYIHRGGGIHGHMHIIYAYIYILFTFAHAHTTYIYTTYNIYIYTRIFPHTYILHIHTLLHTFEPHSDRSLWIFRCRPKNHFWAKSDGFNDTVLVSKSWSFASFLHHFASFFLVLPNVTGTGQNQRLFDFWSLTTFQSRPKKCSFWMSRYVYTCVNIYIYKVSLG